MRTLTWRVLNLLLFSGFVGVAALSGCVSAQSAGDEIAAEQIEQPARPVEKPQIDPFVLVRSTTRLYREPDESADFLQLRSVEQQVAENSALTKLAMERRQRDVKKDKAWDEREKKRVAVARKRARGKKQRAAVQAASRERREAYRATKVAREVGYARKDAQKYPFKSPGMQAIVLKLIAEHDDWLEIETTSVQESSGHCHGQGHVELGQFRIRFFVLRDEVLQTIRERTVIELHAGTSIDLLPGAVVIPVSGKVPRYQVIVDGFEIVVPVAEDVLSDRYRPAKHFEMQTTETVFSDDALMSKALRLDRNSFLPFNPHYRLYVLATSQAKSTVFATTQTPCARYVVKTRHKDLVAAPPNAMRFDLHISHEPPAEPYVVAGTPVFSPGGRQLGEAYVDAHLGVPIRSVQRVSLVSDSETEYACFHKTFGLPQPKVAAHTRQGVDLCVKLDDVVRHELEVF